jgi:hypothetical protein
LRPFAGKINDINIAQALTSFIAIKGTVNEPRITIDSQQALKTAVGVAVNAPAFLGGAMIMGSDDAPCFTALKGTAFENRFPKPTGVKPAARDISGDAAAVVRQQVEGVTQNVREEIDNVRDAARGMIQNLRAPRAPAGE